MNAVTYKTQNNMALLAIAHPPVNALSAAVRIGLRDALERAAADSTIRTVIIFGDGKIFSAGADITEFGAPELDLRPTVHDLQQIVEQFPKKVIAAIHGIALGGALELALACHARVAVATARFGLPEVNLGILPGAGGTQRLPRLTGIETGIELLTNGKSFSAAQALEYGVIDAIVDDLTPGAIAFAQAALSENRVFIPVIQRDGKLQHDAALFDAARQTARRKYRNRAAPLAIVDCVEAATKMPAPEALAFERRKGGELMAGEQHAALKYYFFAEREARKIPGISQDFQPETIRSAAVIGAGIMGGGIAMCFANAGIPVTILDLNEDALTRGMNAVRKNYDISVARGSMPAGKADAAYARIHSTVKYDDIGQADIVIEAALERIDIKREIFTRLDQVMKQGAILASNTSYLDIDAIAEATSRPGYVIGCHFFSPANVMKLLENVRGAKSSPQTIATVMALAKMIGKIPVLAGNTYGFIGNRMLQYYTGEAEFMLEQGATPEQIDRVATNFGMAMGPFSMRDLAGMEMAVISRRERAKTLPEGERLSSVVERMVAAGRVGQKASKGFYRYEGREKFSDPETLSIIAAVSREFGITRRDFTDEEVEARLFAALVNEGAKEIEDGTAIRASDIDVVWVNGNGFPAHKGGPMYWGERFGLDKIYAISQEAGTRNGPRWAPSALLERLATEGRGWKAA